MTEDDFRRVREAWNVRTSGERLCELAGDQVPAVRASVMCNLSPDISDDIAQGIAHREISAATSNWVLRQAIATSTRLLPRHYRAIVSAREWYVCIRLVNNPVCPLDVLTLLAADPDPDSGLTDLNEVHKIARKQLAKQRHSNTKPTEPGG